jgi:DNA-directed RNA polymerase specialized sigma24 family protein
MPAAQPTNHQPTAAATHQARVLSPEVQAAIVKAVRKAGVNGNDREDVQQVVNMELLAEGMDSVDLDHCLALARTKAHDRSVDLMRLWARRGKTNVGPTEEADEHPALRNLEPDACRAIVVKQQAAVFNEAVAEGAISEQDVRILQLDADGLDAGEIAKRVKLAPKTVRNRLSTARKILNEAWAKRSRIVVGGVTILAVLVMLWIVQRKREQYARDHAHDFDITPDRVQTPREPTPMERADNLRKEAWDACGARYYGTCADKLNEAAKLDPASETRQDVKDLRKMIYDAEHVTPGPLKPDVGPRK